MDENALINLGERIAGIEKLVIDSRGDIKQIKQELHQIEIKMAQGNSVPYKSLLVGMGTIIVILSWLASLYLKPLELSMEQLHEAHNKISAELVNHIRKYEIHHMEKDLHNE